MGNWHITSTDLWYDQEGLIENATDAVSFFYVAAAETNNVTIAGTRTSGIDGPGKVVYIAGQVDKGHGYSPTVRMMYDSAIARARCQVGVTAGPAAVNDKIGVYTTGVVKVKLNPGDQEPFSHTVKAGKFVMGTYSGDVISMPAFQAEGVSWIDGILGKAYQSAGAGDEFLMKVLL